MRNYMALGVTAVLPLCLLVWALSILLDGFPS